jgi:steroid 5-alpha reductase family enzyme
MDILLFSLAALFIYMTGLFVISLILKNNGVADIGYGVAFMVVIGTAALLVDSPSSYSLLLLALPFVWGARLAVRIFRKNYGKPEDFRYKAWRDAWGKSFFIRSFLQVYMLQGAVVFVVALPVTLAFVFPTSAPTIALFTSGILVWVLGFFFESVGDYQLDRFLNNPENKGKVMTTGLWRYSRHPNYFGESCMWFGIAIAAASLTILPWLVFISPLLITFLLLYVSGVPLLEKRFEGNPEWEAYKSKTSVFVPLPPKVSR